MATKDGGITWHTQRSGTSTHLTAVSFPDTTHGWAVGFNGVVLATANGGVTWKAQRSNTTKNLHGVSFAEASHGWAVGEGKTILATSDGGAHWRAQQAGTPVELLSVDFTSTSHGSAVGTRLGSKSFYDPWWGWYTVSWWYGVILSTTDGGAHWNAAGTSWEQPFLTYWGDVVATTDGGDSWSQIFADPAMPQRCAVTLVDSTHGWTVLLSVDLVDALHGWAVGDNGTILVTTDGGQQLDAAALRDHPAAPRRHLPRCPARVDSRRRPASLTSCCGQRTAARPGLSRMRGRPGRSSLWRFPTPCTAGWSGPVAWSLRPPPGGFDPAIVSLTGAVEGRWYDKTIGLKLSARSLPPAAAVATLTYSVDGGAVQTVTGATATVTIAVDAATHANDGPHTCPYGATDDRVIVAPDQTITVNVDTRKPATAAPSSAAARRGAAATLKYRVDDTTPCAGTAVVTIKIRNGAGTIVKTLRLGSKCVGTLRSARFTVPATWKACAYRFTVYATDAAGNAQAKAASNRLTVK